MKKILVVILIIGIFGGSFYYWQNKKNNNQLIIPKDKIVTVADGVVVLGARTEVKTIGEFLEEQNIEIKKEDKIYPSQDVKIAGGMKIDIERSVPVTIKVDGQELKRNVFVKTVQEVLKEADITLNFADKIEPELSESIFNDLEIEVTRIKYEEITKEESIDFEVVQKKDKDVKWREKKVKQKGEKGIKEIKYKVTYKNGEEIKREKVSSEITKESVDEITVVGTKIKVGKKQKGLASWYAYTGKMAAASITFPKGTWLRVTAVNSGKQIFVVINDYGPAAYTGKILDLDSVAFKKLAPLGAGVVEVKIEEIK